MEIIEQAIKEGRSTLSEHESKQVLAAYNIPVTREILVHSAKDVVKAAEKIGYPVVLKGCSPEISHKTEEGLIKVDIRNEQEVTESFQQITARMTNNENSVLVQEMVKGQRELVMGLVRDAQFGPCVMFGLGGIFTEILKDISFRVAPLKKRDALEMMHDIKGHKVLQSVRGMEAADLDMLSDMLIQVGRIGLENDRVKEIDINPVTLSGSKPMAVDALVVLDL